MDIRECTECADPAAVQVDITETTITDRGIEFPTRYGVVLCSNCAGEATRILIENGSFHSMVVRARLI